MVGNLFDEIEAGFLYIDSDETIRIFNRTAQKITGIIHESEHPHPSGFLKKGDIIIIADNQLGGDDGGVVAKDLETIGVYDQTIKHGQGLVAIGIYKNKKIKPIYDVLRDVHPLGELKIQTDFAGKFLSASVNYSERLLTIQVGDKLFCQKYLINMGHLVVLDGKTMAVKFVQAKGYSYRNETIKSILQGANFSAKDNNQIAFESIGESIESVFRDSEFVQDIKRILRGAINRIDEKTYLLHQRQLICSLESVTRKGIIKGVAINIIDVSELDTLLKKRDELIEKIEKAVAWSCVTFPFSVNNLANIQGNSQAMQEVKFFIGKAAKVKSTVLLSGENGTGKTMVAREIHRAQSPDAPFIEVNCGSIPQSLFESELFGYSEGSFTGALRGGKEGFFQLANNGTIFLDEITEIPPAIQVKLLHVLQDKRFYPIGASKPITISSRIIAATNRNIKEEISLGRFREDLYYRLNVFPITVPPLRNRMDDIYQLSHSIINKICLEYNVPAKKLSSLAHQELLSYTWPGNVRELENVLERAILITDGSTIYPEHLNIQIEHNSTSLREVREEAEQAAIQSALLRTKDRQELMDILKVSKSTLYEKLKQYKLSL